jgi:sporulation protein YlmC with PRC-barrel domain
MKTFVSFLATAAVLVMVSSANAEEKKTTVYKSTELLNKEIKNRSGDHLGYLEDIAVELPSGRIAYAALSTKNSLGVGGRLFAIPFSALAWSDDHKHLLVDVKKDELEKAEGFDTKSWPNMADAQWAKLGRGTDHKLAKDARIARLSSLTGLSVKNDAGTDLGKVQGFGIDWHRNRIVYAAMSHGGVVGVGSKYFAIPWEALSLKSLDLKVGDRCFVLNADPKDFDNAAGFDTKSWPDKGDERFMKPRKSEK